MEAYQQRVVNELNDLHDRRVKLSEFIRSNEEFGKLSNPEQKLLLDQQAIMIQYEAILDQRVGIFKQHEERRPDSKD
jgi:hypothetical protein